MASKTELSIILKAIDTASGVFSKVGKAVGKLGAKATAIGKKMTMGLTAPLVAMAVASVKAASSFEKGMGNVSTLIDTNVESMEEMSAKVLEMSTAADQAAVPLEDMTGALFDIRSAGIIAGDAMTVLSQAAKLGVAGLGTTKQAADLGTSAINAFALEGEDAAQVFNTFFTATKKGKTTIAELSRGFGSVAGTVAANNIELDEFVAITAALTTTGLKASEAYTQQKAILAGLTRQTEDTRKVFKKLGVKDFPTLVKEAGGFQEAIEQVADGLGVVGTDSKAARKALKRLGATNFKALVKDSGSTSKAFSILSEEIGRNDKSLLKALGSTEALNAVIAITGKQGKTAKEALDEMRSGADNLGEAFDKQNETTAAAMQRTKNSINKAAISIGKILTPFANKVAEIITKVADAFGALDDDTQEVIITIAAVVAVMGPVLLVGGKLISMFALIKGGGAAVIKGLSAATDAMGASSVAAGKLSKVVRFAGAGAGLAAAAVAGWELGRALDNAFGLSDKLLGGLESVFGEAGAESPIAKVRRLKFQHEQDKTAKRRKREADIESGLSPDEIAARDAKSRALSIDARNRRARERSEFDAMFGDPEVGIGFGGTASAAVEQAQGTPGAGGQGGTVEVKFSGVPRGVSVEQTAGDQIDLQVGRQLSS